MARARDMSSGAMPSGPGKGREAHSTSPAASSLLVRSPGPAHPEAVCVLRHLLCVRRIHPRVHPQLPQRRGVTRPQQRPRRKCLRPHCDSAPSRAVVPSLLSPVRLRALMFKGHQLHQRLTVLVEFGLRTGAFGHREAPPSSVPTGSRGRGLA